MLDAEADVAAGSDDTTVLVGVGVAAAVAVAGVAGGLLARRWTPTLTLTLTLTLHDMHM